MDKVELRARLDFWQSALSKLRAAYLALVDGGVKSYVIDDRELTRFDLPDLKDEIEDAEKKVDELLAELNGRKPRKAFGIGPRDWGPFSRGHENDTGKAPERAFCTGSLAEFAPFAAGRPVFYSENGRR